MNGRRTRRRPRRRAVLALALLGAAAVLAAVTPAGAARRLEEKDVNLDIARRVAVRLAAAGVPVVMTRASDRTVPLSARTALANAGRVDAFVSIHNNGSHDRSRHGTEVYRQIRGGESATLGEALRSQLARSPGLPTSLYARRGDHGDYYYVLRNTKMAAVIVEGAYVTNPSDARRLASASFRQKLADSIARGILEFQRTLVAQPLPPTSAPSRVVVQTLAAPAAPAGAAINARTVALSWDAGGVPTYHVYRDDRLLATVSNDGNSRLTFTDVWAAPGQTYRYEIAATLPGEGIAIESPPSTLNLRTPPIVVALDPGHGGADPGAIGSY